MHAISRTFGVPRFAFLGATGVAVLIAATQQWFAGLVLLTGLTVFGFVSGPIRDRAKVANTLPILGWFVASVWTAAATKATSATALNEVTMNQGFFGLIVGLVVAGAVATRRS